MHVQVNRTPLQPIECGEFFCFFFFLKTNSVRRYSTSTASTRRNGAIFNLYTYISRLRYACTRESHTFATYRMR